MVLFCRLPQVVPTPPFERQPFILRLGGLDEIHRWPGQLRDAYAVRLAMFAGFFCRGTTWLESVTKMRRGSLGSRIEVIERGLRRGNGETNARMDRPFSWLQRTKLLTWYC